MSTWPNRGASGGPCGGLQEGKTKQPKQSDHVGLTQANRPPRNPVRFTPGQRHCRDDHAILAARHALYIQARERNPARWSGTTRNWTPIGAVTLNPERDSVVAAHMQADLKQPLAA